jgi:hypothetical protein
MSVTRIRPRAAIADAELARLATLDLPASHLPRRPRTPRGLVDAVTALRRPRSVEPERVIMMTLATVPARRRAS